MYQQDSDKEEEEEQLEGWVLVQIETFTNFVNDNLKTLDLEVTNIKEDFKNGVMLCKLIEVLKKGRIGKIIEKKHINHYEASGNLALALQALAADNIKLVNIGAEDIAGGNRKLILGMIWSLIRHYKLGSHSRLPPKKMMLAWINAVLSPHLNITNFTTDWTNGIALHGIIEYCRPGTFPNWYSMSSSDRLGNCIQAINTANELFDIPVLISAENFSSVDLDDLSTMTYLAYFLSNGAPGYMATLEWVKDIVQPLAVNNFDTDWNSGVVLSHLVRKLGGQPPEEADDDENMCRNAMRISESQFAVPPVIGAKDMADPSVNHIGVMAYAAWHRVADPAPPVILDEPEPEPPVILTHSTPPPLTVPDDCYANFIDALRAGVEGYINIGCESTEGEFKVRARSPENESVWLDVPELEGGCTQVAFKSTTIGEWQIEVTFNGMDIPSSPLFVNVFDPNLATIIRENGDQAYINSSYFFQVDTEQAGSDNITCVIVRDNDGYNVDHVVESLSQHRREVHHTPTALGYHNVTVYLEEAEVPGTPFRVEVLPDPSDIFVYGRGVQEGISKKTVEFQVDAKTGSNNLLLVTITSPSGKPIMSDIRADTEDSFTVSYKPEEPGDYQIEIKYNGVEAPNSPYTVPIKQGQIYVRNLNTSVLYNNKEKFELDATEVTGGDLEIDCGFGPIEKMKMSPNRYIISFTPLKLGSQDMLIFYNGDQIEGNPFYVDVVKR